MTKQFLIAVGIVIVLGGAYFLWQGGAVPEEMGQNPGFGSPSEPLNTNGAMNNSEGQIPDTTSGEEATESGQSTTDAPMAATVTYNGSSFSPAKVSIKKGGTIMWTNTGDTSMWVASAQHPTHTVYAGTNLEEHCGTGANDSFDQCKAGDSYSFTFDKVGTWNYHDHLHASVFGSVEVVE